MIEQEFKQFINHNKKFLDSIDDSTSATVDTGAQRMIIGSNTKTAYENKLPSPLSVQVKEQKHRFKSVNGVTTTEKVACMPASLGPRGCFLKPAIFEEGVGKDAPFLMSLLFLLFAGPLSSLTP